MKIAAEAAPASPSRPHISQLPPVTGRIRAIIIENHTVFATGLRSLLDRLPQVDLCETFAEPKDALQGFIDNLS